MPGRATRLGEREAGGSQPAVPEAWHIVGSQSTSGTMFRIGAEEVSLGRQHCWGGAGNSGLPWSGCSLWVDSPRESASHCPCLAPTPPHCWLGQATVSRPFIFKIPAVFPPQPEGAVPATDPPAAWAWGPEAPGVGLPATPQLLLQFWEGYEARPAGQLACAG